MAVVVKNAHAVAEVEIRVEERAARHRRETSLLSDRYDSSGETRTALATAVQSLQVSVVGDVGSGKSGRHWCSQKLSIKPCRGDVVLCTQSGPFAVDPAEGRESICWPCASRVRAPGSLFCKSPVEINQGDSRVEALNIFSLRQYFDASSEITTTSTASGRLSWPAEEKNASNTVGGRMAIVGFAMLALSSLARPGKGPVDGLRMRDQRRNGCCDSSPPHEADVSRVSTPGSPGSRRISRVPP
ncbi:hypothetical protein QBC39DRAFT_429627 [Podospora conica]|nr:hypothetical protein QBC39DRAFT_429627 [Schizothecium conicum]